MLNKLVGGPNKLVGGPNKLVSWYKLVGVPNKLVSWYKLISFRWLLLLLSMQLYLKLFNLLKIRLSRLGIGDLLHINVFNVN